MAEKQETQSLLSSPGNAYSEEDSLENGDSKKPNGGVPSAKEPHTFDQKISGKAWGRVLQFRKLREFPFSVFFIVGNEFCERFSYYGMRAVLVLFLTSQLDFSDDSATAYYHAFIMLCYFSPLLGAIISDSCLGKYKTILILSVVYAIGNVTVSVSAIPFDRWVNILLVMVGLFIIAFGTGGIKPCVSSFGGDQFGQDQKDLLRRFFSLFYFSINAGSVISTLLTPVLRSQVQCFGSDQCFPLAFGVPAILMIISIFIFVAGTRYYISKKPRKEQALLFIDVPVSVVVAISRRIKLGKQPGKKNFMQYATPKYSEAFVDDVWLLLRVLVMFLPLPIFWTLFDQQGSRWTLQAVRMNGQLGDITIQPDQIQALNPILILVFIPIFELIIYPVFAKCHLFKKPLQRMVAGMVLAGLAFTVAGFVQLKIHSSMETLRGGEAKLVITNGLTDTLQLQLDGSTPFNLSYEYPYLEKTKNLGDHNLTVTRLNGETDETSFQLSSEHIYQIVVTTAEDGSLVFAHTDFKESLPDGDKASIQVINAVHVDGPNDTLNFSLCERSSCRKLEFTADELDFLSTSDQSDVDVGKYYYMIEINTTNISGEAEFTQITSLGVRLDGGGIYTMVITEAEENNNNDTYKVSVTEIDPPNEVSIFLQVPMYVLITAGEVMFSITGLEFAYSQAPPSMKAICQAAWLWTVAFGNLFVVIVAEGSIFSDQAIEFFFFAACIVAVAILFAVMAYFYKYVDLSKRGQEDASEQQHNESSSLVTQNDPSPGEDGRGTNYTMEAKEDTLLGEEDTDPSESEL